MVHSVQCTLYNVRLTSYILRRTMYIVRLTSYIMHRTMYNVHHIDIMLTLMSAIANIKSTIKPTIYSLLWETHTHPHLYTPHTHTHPTPIQTHTHLYIPTTHTHPTLIHTPHSYITTPIHTPHTHTSIFLTTTKWVSIDTDALFTQVNPRVI